MYFRAIAVVLVATFCLVQARLPGGNAYWTDHSLHHPLPENETWFDDIELKEFHFHVYFLKNRNETYQLAMDLFKKVQDLANQGYWKVVPNWLFENPIGPHPLGQYEIWAPREYVWHALSWLMRNRGELSILLHPLSPHEIEDHTGRAMWLAPPYRLDLTVLDEDIGHIPLQYPELGLGYSAKTDTPYPANVRFKNEHRP